MPRLQKREKRNKIAENAGEKTKHTLINVSAGNQDHNNHIIE